MKYLRKILKKLPEKSRLKILYRLRGIFAMLYPFNLNKISKIHKTDKFGYHYYTPHYQKHFRPLKFRKINLLEIGVGGYDNLYTGGNSLRMWKTYFPFAKIYSLDIYDKSFLQESRIKIFKGSQADEAVLETVYREMKEMDIIIDDGSHINEHVIKTFNYLFPKLKKGGLYVVEDTQTSYWSDYGGSSLDFNKEGTIYHYFKSLVDGLNHSEFMLPNYKKSYYDTHITSIHFYHNLIFIYKGDNNEPSNYLINNSVPE
jgi:demethylmacrocin O-methyltransferase